MCTLVDPFALEARYYDKIWGTSYDYHTDTQFLHALFEETHVTRVLDVACGTGEHVVALGNLGYRMVGLDISPAMLTKARVKASQHSLDATFLCGNMTETGSVLSAANVPLPFDAAICMGNALAHLTDDAMLDQTVRNLGQVVKRDGIAVVLGRNAERLDATRLKRLTLDALINEPTLQLTLQSYSTYHADRDDVIDWNGIWHINDHGTLDFQVRTHPLRFYHYSALQRCLTQHDLIIVASYGNLARRERFDPATHDDMYLVCQRIEGA